MKLVDMTVTAFVEELASDSPAPGGGSIAALAGSLAAGLSAMVGGLTVSKEKLKDKWEVMAPVVDQGKVLAHKALQLIDDDTNAFNKLMDAFKLPKNTDEEKAARSKAIQDATVGTIDVPMDTLRLCRDALKLCHCAVFNGNPNAVTDGASGAHMAFAGAAAAAFNARINCSGLKDREKATHYLTEVAQIKAAMAEQLAEIDAKMEEVLAQ